MRADPVSIVIACFNDARFLPAAIESALAQNHRPLEVITVDDGSTEDLTLVTARYPDVRYIRQEHRGAGAAKRRGLSAAKGEFLIYLDADDELLPDAVSSFVACLRDAPDAAFAYGHQQFIDADGDVDTTRPRRDARYQTPVGGDPYSYMLRENHPLRVSGAVCYRTAFLRSIGGPADLEAAADLDLNLRLARDNAGCCNDRVVLSYRVHAGNTSKRYVTMLRASIAAQRRQQAFVDSHPEYADAYREGLRLARGYWGGKVARQMREHARKGDVRAAAGDLAALVRHAPGALFS